MSFASITRGEVRDDHLITTIPSGWAQGRSTFGGVLTAFGFEACSRHAEAPARLLTGRLLEAVTPGLLEAHAQPVRLGRSVQVWSAALRQADRTVGTVDVVFGVPRDSRIDVPGSSAPGGDPDAAAPFGFVPGVTPEFLQQLDMRWLDGPVPFSGGVDAQIGGFCRHRSPASGVGGLLGLLDAWPAPVLGLMDRPAPASTVQWSAHFTGNALADGDWARFRSQTVHAADGYATVHGSLWNADGALLAWNEQLVAIYA